MSGDRLGWFLAGVLLANQVWTWLAGHGDHADLAALERRIGSLEEDIRVRPLVADAMRRLEAGDYPRP
jgi:hypothetical protein